MMGIVSALWEWESMYFPLSNMCSGINVPGGKVQIVFPQSFDFFFLSC